MSIPGGDGEEYRHSDRSETNRESRGRQQGCRWPRAERPGAILHHSSAICPRKACGDSEVDHIHKAAARAIKRSRCCPAATISSNHLRCTVRMGRLTLLLGSLNPPISGVLARQRGDHCALQRSGRRPIPSAAKATRDEPRPAPRREASPPVARGLRRGSGSGPAPARPPTCRLAYRHVVTATELIRRRWHGG